MMQEEMKRIDYSSVCTMDDDNDTHCWSCKCFVFPIGCMKDEEVNLLRYGRLDKDNIEATRN